MITAILIAHNNALYIRDAVLSALRQTPAFESILIVEDCSSDETRTILEELCAQEPRLQLICHTVNKGAGAARNTGIDEVQTEFFCFLDGDDLFFDDCSQKMYQALNQPNIDLWIFGALAFESEGNRTRPSGNIPPSGIFETMEEKKPALAATTFPWNKLYRTEFIRDHGIKFPSGSYEDLPWCFECILSARRVQVVPDLIVHYRIHNQSLLQLRSSAHLDAFGQWKRVDAAVKKHAGPFALSEELCFIHLVRIVTSNRLPESEIDNFVLRVLELCGPLDGLREKLQTKRGRKSLRTFRRIVLSRDEDTEPSRQSTDPERKTFRRIVLSKDEDTEPSSQSTDLGRTAYLCEILKPARLTTIVDVGANPINPAPYDALLDAGLAKLYGFEPQMSAYEELLKQPKDNRVYLPYAIGDGKAGLLYECSHSGFTSLLKPNAEFISFLGRWDDHMKVVNEVEVQTRRLDDVEEITDVDVLKIDIQGGELSVFQNAHQALENTVAIISEVAAIPLYEGQPLLHDQMKELHDLGFALHKFDFFKKIPIKNAFSHRMRPKHHSNQLIDGDGIFLRSLLELSSLDIEQLKHLAIVSDSILGSFDLVLKILQILVEKGEFLDDKKLETYLGKVPRLKH